jgi:vancomycin resistance protein YoaR
VKSNRFTKLIIFFIIIVLFSFVGIVVTNFVYTMTDDIYNGVSVGDIDVGGLSIEQAKIEISNTFRERTQQSVLTLVYNNRWSVTAEEIDLNINADVLAQRAYAVGRKGSVINRLQERYFALIQGHMIPLMPSYNKDKLNAILINIARNIDCEPHNAILHYANSRVNILPEVIGKKVDIIKNSTEIDNRLNLGLPFSLMLAVDEIQPKVLAHDLEDINGVIASYSTQFDSSDKNRSENILIAAQDINGALVKSGEVFSFNTYTGLRLAQYGYKEAPVFINGKLVPDYGGGVCQVSSTLYNAILLADMAVEERTSHFRPPVYVPIGQDATVADNLLDFKFKNTSQSNIYVFSEVVNNCINIMIFGKLSENSPEIQIVATDKKVLEPNTIIKQDPKLEFGKEVVEEGHRGFQVTIYRVKYLYGEEIGREYITTDEFMPVDEIIRIGREAYCANK